MAKAISPAPSSKMDVADSNNTDFYFDGQSPEEDSDLDENDIHIPQSISQHSVRSKSSSPKKSPNHKMDKSPKHEKNHEEDVVDGQMLNGFASQADRYGFVGGKEFTDPEQ